MPLNTPNVLKRERLSTETVNALTFQDYFMRLETLAISQWEWTGLPSSVEEHFIEECLCEIGYCLYFRDEIMGDLALTTTIGPRLNVYNIPVYRRAYAANGYSLERDDTNSVLIYNNYLHSNSFDTILLFARRLYEIERTIDVNVKAQKTPILIATDESQLLTMKNVYKQYKDNEPVVFGQKALSPNSLQVFQTSAPFVADKLQILKRQIWNEFLTFIGVENSNTEKRERLVTDEITSNLGGVNAQRWTYLAARQEAARRINAMFGTNISVRPRQDWTALLNEYGPDSGEGDNPDE